MPFDPELPYLFMGEELLYSARLWTAGWEIFTPVTNLVFHHYARKRGKSVFADHSDGQWWSTVQETHKKAKFLMGLSDERPGPELAANMSRYGMGTQRSVAEYFAFANFDLPNNKSNTADKFCGNGPLELSRLEQDNKCLADFARGWKPEDRERY